MFGFMCIKAFSLRKKCCIDFTIYSCVDVFCGSNQFNLYFSVINPSTVFETKQTRNIVNFQAKEKLTAINKNGEHKQIIHIFLYYKHLK